MKKKKLSISDVAKATGVSVTTVSLVLNDKGVGRISPGIIRKVKDYAKKVGYMPNPLVRKRNANTSKVFGVLVEDIASSIQSEFVSQLGKIMRQRGHHTVIVSMNGETAIGERLLLLLQEKEMDGYVLMGFEHMERALQRVIDAKKPVVLYDCQSAGLNLPTYCMDYRSAVVDAIHKHFRTHPNSRLGMIAYSSNTSRIREVLAGYMQVMDLHSHDVLIKKLPATLSDMEVENQIDGFVRDNRLDAVLFATEQLARIGARIIKSEQILTWEQDTRSITENITESLLKQFRR